MYLQTKNIWRKDKESGRKYSHPKLGSFRGAGTPELFPPLYITFSFCLYHDGTKRMQCVLFWAFLTVTKTIN